MNCIYIVSVHLKQVYEKLIWPLLIAVLFCLMANLIFALLPSLFLNTTFYSCLAFLILLLVALLDARIWIYFYFFQIGILWISTCLSNFNLSIFTMDLNFYCVIDEQDHINNWRDTALILTSILFLAAGIWFIGE